jgi:hypothetical protein
LNIGGAKSNFPEQIAKPSVSDQQLETREPRSVDIPIYRHRKNLSQGSKPILR